MARVLKSLGIILGIVGLIGWGLPSAQAEGVPTLQQADTLRLAGWRGDGSGRYASANPVTRWSAQENILWKTEVGTGQSSPLLVGRRLFVTAEPNQLLCLDSASGQLLWSKTNDFSSLPASLNAKAPSEPNQYGEATPTPVSDGKRAWVYFGTGIVACYDLSGVRQWIHWFDLPQTTSYGRTASPVLAGEHLLVHFGPLVCLDAKTGNPLWTNDTVQATYGTPASTRIGAVDVLITPKGQVVRVSDGKVLAADLGNCMYTSPIVQGRMVYFIDAGMTAVRLPDKADVPLECKELWSEQLEGEIFASPLFDGTRLYTIDKAGSYFVLDATTGKTILNKTLEFSRQEGANAYPSLCLAGQHLFVGNDVGDMLLLEPGDQGKIVGSNSLPRGSGATPVFSGKRIYLRGGKLLYCIGKE